ncbi:MAG: indole-3-glycerol phosphate synthase TrpC [Bacteroidota bacterium]
MTILDRIVADTRRLVDERKRQVSVRDLEARPFFAAPARPFAEVLRQPDEISVIAEIKRASPSAGVIREPFDVPAIARAYEAGGAAAISVLTEPLHFQGALENLTLARPHTKRPLMRKDFIVDPYQLIEAKAYGADAVLLIAAVLDRHKLHDLHQAADDLGLGCLVELYDAGELSRVDLDQVRVLGVNNRDLRTFEVDIEHSLRVFAELPAGVVRVSESGLKTAAHLAHLRRHGTDAVLIGESLMRAPDPGDALRRLRTDTLEALRESV